LTCDETYLDNANVLRTLIAVGLSVAVQFAAAGAPLVHAHLGGHGSDHHGSPQTIHSHFSGHSTPHHHPGGRNFDDNDAEHTVFLQWFVAVGVASFHLPPALVSSFDLIPPAAAAPHEVLQVVHGHDPPLARSGPSRAPPAILS